MPSSERNGGVELDAASASASRLSGEPDEASLTPVVAPRVLDDPVVTFGERMAIADGEHRMIKIVRMARAVFGADDAFLVIVDRIIVRSNGNGDRALHQGFLQRLLRLLVDLLVA